MKCYAIVKVGNDYVVEVNHLAVMTFSSRRQAARLVAMAEGLLGVEQPAQPAGTPSLTRERCEVP